MPTATDVAPVVPSSRLRTTRLSPTDHSAFHRGGARAGSLRGNLCDETKDELAHLLSVGRKESLDVRHRDRLDVRAPFEACVVIGDEREVEVAHLELASEHDLGILRHVDDVHPIDVNARLSARVENRGPWTTTTV